MGLVKESRKRKVNAELFLTLDLCFVLRRRSLVKCEKQNNFLQIEYTELNWQEEGDDDKDLDDGEGDDDHDGDGDGSPDSADECQIIANNQVAAAFVLESVRNEER